MLGTCSDLEYLKGLAYDKNLKVLDTKNVAVQTLTVLDVAIFPPWTKLSF